MQKSELDSTIIFQDLNAHHAEMKNSSLRDLFAADPSRFERFSINASGLFLDYSKNNVSIETMRKLFSLARERQVETRRQEMFSGKEINTTEGRSVLHTLLREPKYLTDKSLEKSKSDEVHATLQRVRIFTEKVRSEKWLGYSGESIKNIVNIGIGGSDLGPKMVCQALRAYQKKGIELHFVSNIDGSDLDATLKKIRPQNTLFIVSSKTFTTTETMKNAQSARNWFLESASEIQESDLCKHFVAVSTNIESATRFGISSENIFPFWDWVGGRYSVWSSIGLPIALSIGFNRFSEFLSGASAMDRHFQNAPLEKNMPVVLALLGIWYRNFFDYRSISIAPYHNDLVSLPSYLQQLEMESNGKRINSNGNAINYASCPILWGNVGTNGQHAYFQLLHQGTDITPVDFIAALKENHSLEEHQTILLANCFAQSEALMLGKNGDEVQAEMQSSGISIDRVARLLPHRVFPGNRPSNTILMDELNPANLGSLISLYEHKVFVQGVIWDLNSFDQWGVELGKVLAKNILEEMNTKTELKEHDSSTRGLINMARKTLL
jgi:glucose-6-phosphate isomerase